MRPKKHETTGSGDLFRARLDQIINMRHELVQLAGKIDWEFIDSDRLIRDIRRKIAGNADLEALFPWPLSLPVNDVPIDLARELH